MSDQGLQPRRPLYSAMQAVSESPRPPGYSGRVSKLRAHAANYTRKLPAHLAHVVRVYGPPACKLLGKATVRLLALLGKGLALGAFVVGKFTLTALWKLHREQERRRTGFQVRLWLVFPLCVRPSA